MKHFKLYFDNHRADNLVWEIDYFDQNSNKNTINWYSEVFVSVPIHTEYYGPTAKQPRAVVKGKCSNMEVRGTKLYIT